LCHPFPAAPALDQSPAPQDRSPREVEREPLIGSESLECLGQLEGPGRIPVELVDDGDPDLRLGQAGGMPEPTAQFAGVPAPLQSPLGMAEHPKSMGRMPQTASARVMAAIEKGMRPVLTRVVDSDCLLQVSPCSCPISAEGMGRPQRV